MASPLLDRYFERLDWSPSGEQGAALLHALHGRHPVCFPFENLGPLLGHPVALDTASLIDKMLSGGRGGYCFEQNRLMAEVLSALGFPVRYLAARVHWNNPPELRLPRTHVLLLVEAERERWLVDVGFGGLTPLVPLRLQAGVEQSGREERFLLSEAAEGYTLNVRADEGWKPMYQFGLQPQEPADLEMMNWYVSTHPSSRFVQQLMAGRREAGRRFALLDNRLTVYHGDGRQEQRLLETAPALQAVLENELRIRLPAGEALDGLLSRLVAPAT